MEMNSLQGKVALITGAGQGHGAVLARTLAKEGVKLVLGDIQEEKVKQVAADISKDGGEAEGVMLDVTKADQIDSVVEQIITTYGTIDILVNNAGMDYTKPIEKFSVEEIDRELNINLRGPWLLCRKVIPFMYQQKSGHIINIGSTASKTAWEFTSAYHATKWGLRGLSYGLHVEARWKNVKVTYMIPGGMNTAHNLERDQKTDWSWLQPPENVAESIKFILKLPGVTTVPEMMVIPIADWSLFPLSDKIEKQMVKGGIFPEEE